MERRRPPKLIGPRLSDRAAASDGYLTYGLIRSGDYLAVIMVITFTVIPPDFSVEVMAAAGRKLP
jgi:hypothetical protein